MDSKPSEGWYDVAQRDGRYIQDEWREGSSRPNQPQGEGLQKIPRVCIADAPPGVRPEHLEKEKEEVVREECVAEVLNLLRPVSAAVHDYTAEPRRMMRREEEEKCAQLKLAAEKVDDPKGHLMEGHGRREKGVEGVRRPWKGMEGR